MIFHKPHGSGVGFDVGKAKCGFWWLFTMVGWVLMRDRKNVGFGGC